MSKRSIATGMICASQWSQWPGIGLIATLVERKSRQVRMGTDLENPDSPKNEDDGTSKIVARLLSFFFIVRSRVWSMLLSL